MITIKEEFGNFDVFEFKKDDGIIAWNEHFCIFHNGEYGMTSAESFNEMKQFYGRFKNENLNVALTNFIRDMNAKYGKNQHSYSLN